MVNTSRLARAVGVLILMACPLLAQDQRHAYKGSVYGGLGYGKFYDDEGSLGSGLTYRAGAEWRPLRRGGFEAELFGVRFNRGDYFNVHGNAQFALVNATWYFSRSGVQPYLKAGIGAYRTRYIYFWPATSGPTFQNSRNGLAVDIGAGLRLFLSRSWSLNPDLRLIGGRGYFSLFSYFSMSAAYHW